MAALEATKRFANEGLRSLFAPPGATFQINVRPPLRMDSGVSCHRKTRNPRCLWTWLGGVAAAPSAVLRFGRCTSCVVKVFGKKSQGPASDAHRMARYRGWIWEIAESSKIPIHPGFSAKSYVFLRFERAKPLQTFPTSTALLVGRLCELFVTEPLA